MAEAAIVVLPSRWAEPFARVALEALGCGAALVASPRGGIPEAVGDAALYANPDEPTALAEAMLAAGARSGAAGGAAGGGPRAGRPLSLAATAAAYAALWSRLLGASPSPGAEAAAKARAQAAA